MTASSSWISASALRTTAMLLPSTPSDLVHSVLPELQGGNVINSRGCWTICVACLCLSKLQSACKFPQVRASSRKFVQVHASSCKFTQVCSSFTYILDLQGRVFTSRMEEIARWMAVAALVEERSIGTLITICFRYMFSRLKQLLFGDNPPSDVKSTPEYTTPAPPGLYPYPLHGFPYSNGIIGQQGNVPMMTPGWPGAGLIGNHPGANTTPPNPLTFPWFVPPGYTLAQYAPGYNPLIQIPCGGPNEATDATKLSHQAQVPLGLGNNIPPLFQAPVSQPNQTGTMQRPQQVPLANSPLAPVLVPDLLIPPVTKETIPTQGPGSAPMPAPLPSESGVNHSAAGGIMDDMKWPVGEVRREAELGMEPHKWNVTNWVWRSQGNMWHQGRRVEKRNCLGVLKCPSCGRLTRPKTNPDSLKAQKQQLCRSGSCLSPDLLHHARCTAFTLHYKQQRDDRTFLIWEHFGDHANHERPPGGPISKDEEDQIDRQVERSGGATAHQLRTGATTPGSVPLATISPVLANPRAARYQLGRSQERLGIIAPLTKGVLAGIHALGQLDRKHGTLLIDSRFNAPVVYATIQTPFMLTILHEVVAAWIKDFNEGVHEGRHGFVTDGDHSFFQMGQLLTTCGFSSTMNAWVPVLYSWVDAVDTDHHRPHFEHLFRGVLDAAGSSFEPKMLLNVMDFSAAQRNAHAHAYAEIMCSRMPSFNFLSSESQVIERQRFYNDALKVQVGCDVHFRNSVTRIKRNGSIIPANKAKDFQAHCETLISPSTNNDHFDQTVRDLQQGFPRARPWLNWWLRPTMASMIFPCKSAVARDLASRVPSTSNPVEHQHSLLHHAVGKDYDIIPGVEKIHLHVKELESQYKAIQGGHFLPPTDIRNARRVGFKKYDVNDGRPPDTTDALLSKHDPGLPPATPLRPQTPGARLWQSFTWNGHNSCFYDVGAELMFRAYSLWDPATQQTFRNLLPSNSALAHIFFGYQRRLSWISDSKKTDVDGTRMLEMMQTWLHHAIFTKWKLYASPSDFGCAKTWIHHAVKDSDPPILAQKFLGVEHSFVSSCPIHASVMPAHAPEAIVDINSDDMVFAHQQTGQWPVPLSSYFSLALPRRRIGPHTGGTSLLHLLSPFADFGCQEPHCSNTVEVASIETAWPQILQLVPSYIAASKECLADQKYVDTPLSFTIQHDSTSNTIEYELVGRIVHLPLRNHWILQVRIGDHCYSYDDMENQGQLVYQGDPSLLTVANPDVALVTYHRTSTQAVTCRPHSMLVSAYTNYEKLKSDPIHISSSPVPSIITSRPFPSLLPSSPSLLPRSPSSHQVSLQGNTSPGSSPWHVDCYCDGKTHGGRKTIQCDTCMNWSHWDCMETLHMVSLDINAASTWTCLSCDVTPITDWFTRMKGKFLMMGYPPTMRPRKEFPAQIMGILPNTKQAQLKWYSGNKYPITRTPPSSPTFTCTVIECFTAYNRDISDFTERNVGTIQWPLWLIEDAADNHKYRHNTLIQALKDSMPYISSILNGSQYHPIMSAHSTWNASLQDKRASRSAMQQFAFSNFFYLPVLPGDLSLFGLQEVNGDVWKSVRVQRGALMPVFEILCSVVILRTYLRRNQEDDEQVYYLAVRASGHHLHPLPDNHPMFPALDGHLTRYLTEPEEASIAEVGFDEALRAQRLAGNLTLAKLKKAVDRDAEHPLDTGSPLVSAYSGDSQPYTWLKLTQSPANRTSGPHQSDAPLKRRAGADLPLKSTRRKRRKRN
ncbi:hypothetical protein AB1N83_010648 [Pleurotus pulmonarius]